MQPRETFVEQISLPWPTQGPDCDIFTASFFSPPPKFELQGQQDRSPMFEMLSDQGLFPPAAAAFGKAAFTNTRGKTQIQKVKRM